MAQTTVYCPVCDEPIPVSVSMALELVREGGASVTGVKAYVRVITTPDYVAVWNHVRQHPGIGEGPTQGPRHDRLDLPVR